MSTPSSISTLSDADYTLVATVPFDQAFRPLSEGGCAL